MLFIPRPPQARCEGGYSFLLAKHRLTPSTPDRKMRPIYTHTGPTLLPYYVEKKGKGGREGRKCPPFRTGSPRRGGGGAPLLTLCSNSPTLDDVFAMCESVEQTPSVPFPRIPPHCPPIRPSELFEKDSWRTVQATKAIHSFPPFRSTLADNSLLKTAPYDSTAGHFP